MAGNTAPYHFRSPDIQGFAIYLDPEHLIGRVLLLI
jgi:hypothetical protein